MHKVNLLRAFLISLALLCATATFAQTYTDLVGTGFSSWPSNAWVPIPSLDEGRDKAPQVGYSNVGLPPKPWTDFVGNSSSSSSHLGYYQFDTDYLYFRMRLDQALPTDGGGNVTFGEQLYIFVDMPDLAVLNAKGNPIPNCPDYAIRWDMTAGLRISRLTTPISGNESKWLWNNYDPTQTTIIHDSYLRMVTGDTALADLGSLPYDPAYPQTKKNYDPQGTVPGELVADAWIDWALSWDYLAGIDYGDTFSVNYGSSEEPLTADPKNDYWDIGAGEEASANEMYNDDGVNWSDPPITTPEPASMALTLVAVGLAGGIARRRKARNEAGREE
ncbi:MAG TPA: hypothetical protein DEP45_03940 [Armatimonadetes bacterium]|nr:hypothetical protein [Armatimonadota bacterium]